MSHDVFISYSSKDKVVADAVCAKLEESRIRAWIAPRDVPPGQDFASAIIQAIDQSKVLVLIWSQEANKSKHILNEVNHAFNQNTPVIPFRIDDVVPTESFEYYIGHTHWLDAMTPPLEKHLKKLTSIIHPYLSGQEDIKTPTAQEAQAAGKEFKPEAAPPAKPPGKPRRLWAYLAGAVGLAAVAVVVLWLTVFNKPTGEVPPVGHPISMTATSTVSTSAPTAIDVSNLTAPTPTLSPSQGPFGIELLEGYEIRHLLQPGLINPTDVQVGPDGRIFVVEWQGTQILELGYDGSISTFLELEKPFNSLLVNSKGDLFVMQGEKLMKITPEKETSVYYETNAPGGWVFDPQDNLYMIAGGELQKVSPEGEMSVIATGIENGRMAISPAGDIYIASGSEGCIHKVTKGGSYSSLTCNFVIDAFSIAFDSEGQLYQNQRYFTTVSLTDGSFSAPIMEEYNAVMNNRPFAFTPSGDIVLVGPSSGNAILASIDEGTAKVLVEGIGNATGMTLDSSGSAFLGAGNEYPLVPGKVVKILPDGSLSAYASGLANVRDLVMDDEGNLLVSDFGLEWEGGGRLIRISPAGVPEIVLSGFYDLGSLVYHPGTGDIFAFEQNSRELLRVPREGLVESIPIDFGGEVAGLDLALDTAGGLLALVMYVDDGMEQVPSVVFRISAGYEPTLIRSIDSPVSISEDELAVDASGNIYVIGVEQSPYSRMIKISPEGDITLIAWHLPHSAQSLAISEAGELYFTCSAGLFKIIPTR